MNETNLQKYVDIMSWLSNRRSLIADMDSYLVESIPRSHKGSESLVGSGLCSAFIRLQGKKYSPTIYAGECSFCTDCQSYGRRICSFGKEIYPVQIYKEDEQIGWVIQVGSNGSGNMRHMVAKLVSCGI
jgi:hypothetical protein